MTCDGTELSNKEWKQIDQKLNGLNQFFEECTTVGRSTKMSIDYMKKMTEYYEMQNFVFERAIESAKLVTDNDSSGQKVQRNVGKTEHAKSDMPASSQHTLFPASRPSSQGDNPKSHVKTGRKLRC